MEPGIENLPPLDLAAALEAPQLDAADLYGACIVTGQWRNGRATFASVGIEEDFPVAAPNRIFEIGSISKIFTGLMLAREVAESDLEFSTTLGEMLADDVKFSDPRVAAITLAQLSSHTSGLPRLPANLATGGYDEADPYAHYDRKMMFEALAECTLPPGDGPFPASYSNFAVGLLGDLLARRAGTDWESLVRRLVIDPLKLDDTRITLTAEQAARLMPPHAGGVVSPWRFQALVGAGGLRSSAKDMIAFGKFLMEPDDSPLGRAALEIRKPRADFGALGGKVGLGLVQSEIDGQTIHEHNGGTGGFRSVLQFSLEAQEVRVVLVNQAEFTPESVIEAARKAARGELNPELPTAIQLDPAALDRFCGIYGGPDELKFTVLRNEEMLVARLFGQHFNDLRPLTPQRFRFVEVDAELEFILQDDKVTGLVLFQNGRKMPSKRIDENPPQIEFPVPAELEPLLGTYQLQPGVILEMRRIGSTLSGQLTGQPAFPMFRTRADFFELEIVKAAVEFKRDENGKVTELVLHQNGDHRAPKIK